MTVSDRVKSFVEDEQTTPELIREWLWRMTDNCNQTRIKSKRMFVLFLTSLLAFELLHLGFLSEFSLGGAKLANLPILGPLLIPVAAYFYLASVSSYASSETFSDLIGEVAEIAFGGLDKSALVKVLPNTDVVALGEVPSEFLPLRLQRIDNIATGVQAVAFPLAGLATLVYGGIRLFGSPINPIYAAVCFLLTLIAIAMAEIYFWTYVLSD